jgi:hypothetical protein
VDGDLSMLALMLPYADTSKPSRSTNKKEAQTPRDFRR